MVTVYLVLGIGLLAVGGGRAFDVYVAVSGRPVAYTAAEAAWQAALILAVAGAAIGRAAVLLRRRRAGGAGRRGFAVEPAGPRPPGA